MSSSDEEGENYLAKRHLERLTGECHRIIDKVRNSEHLGLDDDNDDAEATVVAGKENIILKEHTNTNNIID